MKTNRWGYYLIPTLIILNILVWLVFPPVYDGREDFVRTYIGEVLGSTVIILMSYSLFLSTRPKWAEKYFGGLDKMYRVHRRSSVTAFFILAVHLLIVPISFGEFRLGNYLALIAFTGVVSIVLITLAPGGLAAESYQGWKKLHRFIGIFFIIGFIHAITVDSLDALIAITWVQLFFILGVLSYLYTEIFQRYFRKGIRYGVESINKKDDLVTELVLQPDDGINLEHRAGQFLFVRFPVSTEINESHPFTISSAPSEDVLRLTIKSVGDFTSSLRHTLNTGDKALVEGPYGLFDYTTGGKKQIWVAGGIGVTPFLSFVREMGSELEQTIHFVWSVRSSEEEHFKQELEQAAQKIAGLDFRMHYSIESGHLQFGHFRDVIGEEIFSYDLYLCGPSMMVEDFTRDALRAGFSPEKIHYEEFSLR